MRASLSEWYCKLQFRARYRLIRLRHSDEGTVVMIGSCGAIEDLVLSTMCEVLASFAFRFMGYVSRGFSCLSMT